MDLLTLRNLHPEWDVVDYVEAPNGGIWAMGRDGGVFALDAEGGTTGATAPFAGSYTSLAPEQRQGTRSFEDIRFDQNTNTYTLVSNMNETYNFGVPTATAPINQPTSPTGEAVAPPPPGDDTSGRDVFLNTLVGMGFSRDQANSLGNTLWTNSKTKSQDALYFDLISSPEYAARFPGMKALRDQGIAIDESQYIGLERAYKGVAQSFGLPGDFYNDPADFGKLIANGVSPEEYRSRVQWGQTAALSDPTFIEELAREVPGFTVGDAVAFYLDPDKGTEYLQQKTTRATYGTAARTNLGLSLDEAEKNRLQAQGLTGAQATERFGQLGTQTGLISNTAGETMTDQQFTRSEQVGYVAGDTAAQMELEERRKRRQAQFQGGGGASGGGRGETGLG